MIPRHPLARAIALPRRLPLAALVALALALLALLGLAARVHAQPNSGIRKDYMDTTVDPCTDFWSYANGGWLKTAVIPESYVGIGAGRDMFDRNQEALYKVLEDTKAKAPTTKDATLRKLGYLYASAMDSARADQEGWQPIADQLKQIDAIASKEDLRKQFARMQKDGFTSPFNFGPETDPSQSSMVIGQIYQAGLGLPDRDYYFKTDPKSDSIRTEYVAHLGRLFRLVGVADAEADARAQKVMAIETALAESSMTRVAQRNPHAIYHKMSVKQLSALAPSVDWTAYFGETGVTVLAKPDAQLDVSQPAFVRQVEQLISTKPLEDWKAYCSSKVINTASPWLGQKFFDEAFRFNSVLSGIKAPPPRWTRAAGVADAAMGEALGKAYVEMMFPASSKAKMLEMVNNLQAVLKERIESRDWMSPATKAAGIKKLDAVLKKIGYPDKWRDYSALEIDPKAPGAENLRRARAFEAARTNAQIGKPLDRTEWGMSPPTVNAYYNPQINEIVFPAGILIPPRFDPTAPDPVNYGAIGTVIGHEMSHGFDDQGRQYDAQGNLKDWWAPDDAKQFTARAQKVVDQYDGYIGVDTLHVNGRLTLGENIADLGGLTISYWAMERAMKDKPKDKIDGFTPEQLFFLGYAQGWRSKNRPEAERLRVLSDPHSPNRYRVNGPLSNFPEFAKAWGCKAGSGMVRDDSIRAEIW
jgi:putative endopeptidase